MDGVLPKMIQAWHVIQQSNVTLLLLRPWDRFIEEIIEHIGVDKQRVHYYDGGFYSADFIIDTCVTPALHPDLWGKAKYLLLNRHNTDVPIPWNHNHRDMFLQSYDTEGRDAYQPAYNTQTRGSFQQPRNTQTKGTFLQRYHTQTRGTFQEPHNTQTRGTFQEPHNTQTKGTFQQPHNTQTRGTFLQPHNTHTRDTLLKTYKEQYIILLEPHLRARHKLNRKIINISIIKHQLQKRYGDRFKVITGAEPLQEVLSVFRNAQAVIGVQGAGFYNMFFSPPGTHFIEVTPVNSIGVPVSSSDILWKMSSLLDHHHWMIYQQTDAVSGNVHVPFNKLNDILDKV